MIVKMKKAAIILLAPDTAPALKDLRRLGVLHVEHTQPPESKDTASLKEELSRIKEAMALLGQYAPVAGKSGFKTKQDREIRQMVAHIIDCHKRIVQLREYSGNLAAQIEQWKHWGDFAPEEVRLLREKGVYLKLYQIPQKDLKGLAQDLSVNIIFSQQGIAYCAVASDRDFNLDFTEMPLPRMGLAEMRRRLGEEEKALQLLKEDISEANGYYQDIVKLKKITEKEIEFQEAIKGMGQAGELAYLSGYLPVDKTEALLNLARHKQWGMSLDEPSDEDKVPTLIRNPRWVSIINPVFRLLEIIPAYQELDISPLFLCFLSLFFGMIIGDAGYGAVYFLLTFWLKRRFAKRFPDQRVFFLFYVFSTCAIFWGILTGTVFGQEWYLKAGLKPVVPVLNDTKFLQAFCFFLGAFHLTLAHSWQAIRKMPSLTALADTGWICILWAGFFLARNLILDYSFPYFGKWLIICGATLVIFFSNPQKNILRTAASGLGALALSLVSNFTDVVSYVRLFAVGLAGIAISDTVNMFAAAFAGNPLAAVLIIFIGHSINIILGPLSVLVHGIRLNVLEFSVNHANLSWSGIAYKPLKE